MASLLAVLDSLGAACDLKHDVTVRGFSLDSRKVQPGDVFLAFPGSTADGRLFIKEALSKGAIACLIEAGSFNITPESNVPLIKVPDLKQRLGYLLSSFYQHPSAACDLIGVTGTNGKSSVVLFLAQAIQALQRSVGVLGTIGNGVWPRLTTGELTTLDAVELNRWLCSFRSQSMDVVAMEVSSHALSQYRVCGLQYDVAVFTGLSHDHLDYHGTMQAYAEAKFTLFDFSSLKCGVVNLDDSYAPDLLRRKDDSFWVGYTLCGRRDCGQVVSASEIQQDGSGVSFDVDSPWGSLSLRLPLFGRFNISNALAAVAVIGSLGFSIEEIQASIQTLKPVKGRMEVIETPGFPTVVVDYAHTPDALANALSALREHLSQKIWCVFGCGGDRDSAKRPLMAKAAETLADHVIVTSDNSRGEPIDRIMKDISAGFRYPDRVIECVDRVRAITLAIKSAGESDVILLAGRGHEIVMKSQSGPECARSDYSIVQGIITDLKTLTKEV